MKKWKYIDKAEFKRIKQLHEAGLNAKQIVAVLGNGRATGTIQRAWAYDTLEEYRAGTKAEHDAWVAKRKEKTPKEDAVVEESDKQKPDAPTPTSSYEERVLEHMEEVAKAYTRQLELMRIQTSAMERQAAALERLADAWENSPKKVGLFGK